MMPVNCPYCGVTNQPENRFCICCGAALPTASPREAKGTAGLRSALLDRELPTQAIDEDDRPKSDRKLNVALAVLFVLAATLTVVMLVLFGPKEENQDGGTLPAVTAPPDDDTVIIVPETMAPESAMPVPSTIPTSLPVNSPSPAPTAKPQSEYILPESDTRYLTAEDLAGLSHEQLCLARNEIFARHGRIFTTPQLAAYFQGKSWYQGRVSAADFKESVFNAYERANISFITDYEDKNFGGSYY